MPKLREAPEQMADRAFREGIAAGLAREDMTNGEAADKLRIARQTFSTYKRNPSKFTVNHLRRLWKCGLLTEADVTRTICY